MSVDHLGRAVSAPPRAEASSGRYWLGPVTALCDVAVVAAIAYATSVLNDLVNHDALRLAGPAVELAAMLASLFLFVNLMRSRYRIENYLSTRGQVAAAFSAWNIAMIAFLGLLVLAKIADHYSRAAILATYVAVVPAITLCRAAIIHLIASGSRSGRITAERIFLIGSERDVMSFVRSWKPWNLGSAIVDVAFLHPARSHQEGRGALAADLAAAVASCRTKRPDAVFAGNSGTPGALPYLELANRQYAGRIYGTHGLINADFVRVGGRSIEGLEVPSGPVLVAEQLPAGDPVREASMAFRTSYEKLYGAPPVDAFSAYTYDALLVLADAAARVKDEQPGTPAYRQALKEAIVSTRDLAGTHGIYTFTPDSRYGLDERAVVMVRMEGGRWKLAAQPAPSGQ